MEYGYKKEGVFVEYAEMMKLVCSLPEEKLDRFLAFLRGIEDEEQAD